MSGKGSKPRPYSVSQEEFSDRYDAIFGKKNDAPSSNGKAAVSTTENLRSSRSGAASEAELLMMDRMLYGVSVERNGTRIDPATIYINPETGEQVTEDWWPEIINKEQSA